VLPASDNSGHVVSRRHRPSRRDFRVANPIPAGEPSAISRFSCERTRARAHARADAYEGHPARRDDPRTLRAKIESRRLPVDRSFSSAVARSRGREVAGLFSLDPIEVDLLRSICFL